MPNLLAYVVLLVSPFVIVVIFRKMRSFEAIIWSTLWAYLYLPTGVGFDFPLLPPIEKTLIANVSIVMLSLWLASKSEVIGASWGSTPSNVGGIPSRSPTHRFYVFFVVLFFWLGLSSILTAMTNGEPLFYGPFILPGLRINDAFALIVESFVSILPFVIAARFLNTPEHHYQILRCLSIFGLAYSLFMLVEVRMSPIINNWVYGYFPPSFMQHFRGDGWRPIVFLVHGLRVGIFVAMAVLASFALWRQTRRSVWLASGLWLLLILYLSKNLGAFSLALLFTPVLILTGARLQILLVACVAAIVLLYPMLRGAGWIPTEFILDLAYSVNAERGQSLDFRFLHEDSLLERANEKPLFGWGSWGRPQLHDPITGEALSVTDGSWVIIIGAYGWFGYVAQFGLLTVPLLTLFIFRRKLEPSKATAGLSVILAINLIDLIPNSSVTPILFLVAGALQGAVLFRESYRHSGSAVPMKEKSKIEAVAIKPHTRQPRV